MKHFLRQKRTQIYKHIFLIFKEGLLLFACLQTPHFFSFTSLINASLVKGLFQNLRAHLKRRFVKKEYKREYTHCSNNSLNFENVETGKITNKFFDKSMFS